MHGKVRKQTVTLAGYQGQALFPHIVEHIAEQPEIKVRRRKSPVAQAGDRRDHDAGEHPAGYGKNGHRAGRGTPTVKERFVPVQGADDEKRIDGKTGKNEQSPVLRGRISREPDENADRCAGKHKPRIGVPCGDQNGDAGKKKKKQRRAPQQMKKRDLLRKGKQGKVRFSVGKSAGEHQEDENTPCGNQPADDPVTLKGGAQALLYPFFYHFLSVSPCRTSIFYGIYCSYLIVTRRPRFVKKNPAGACKALRKREILAFFLTIYGKYVTIKSEKINFGLLF